MDKSSYGCLGDDVNGMSSKRRSSREVKARVSAVTEVGSPRWLGGSDVPRSGSTGPAASRLRIEKLGAAETIKCGVSVDGRTDRRGGGRCSGVQKGLIHHRVHPAIQGLNPSYSPLELDRHSVLELGFFRTSGSSTRLLIRTGCLSSFLTIGFICVHLDHCLFLLMSLAGNLERIISIMYVGRSLGGLMPWGRLLDSRGGVCLTPLSLRRGASRLLLGWEGGGDI